MGFVYVCIHVCVFLMLLSVCCSCCFVYSGLLFLKFAYLFSNEIERRCRVVWMVRWERSGGSWRKENHGQHIV